MAHPTLTDAGGKPVLALPGACTFDSAMSFGLIRGGHVDLTVLGALQVDGTGGAACWQWTQSFGQPVFSALYSAYISALPTLSA
jgi:acyl CoA:acetate/3-ketoacid CoA transferase beta subunit